MEPFYPLPDSWFEPQEGEWPRQHRIRIIDAHARHQASDEVVRKWGLPPHRLDRTLPEK